MRKGMLTGIALLMVVPGLLTLASCGKKEVVPQETMVSSTSQEDADAARRAEEERQQQLAQQARQQEESIRQEALRKEQAAKEDFTGNDVYFEYDSAVLTSEAQALLMVKAQWMQANPNSRALIEGHCDERGSNEYNLALGDRRAAAVKTFLVNLGISAYRLSTVSYGEEKPMDTGKTESAYAKNRRAHFGLK
jgi:peptidoglycan-associated lipoprotein